MQICNSDCPPKKLTKFCLQLLSVFFEEAVLARSNCTKAKGRDLLDQTILQMYVYVQSVSVSHSYMYVRICYFVDHTNYKYPMESEEKEER